MQRNETLPAIIGRFSQRNQKTISRVNDDKIKLLALKLYQEKRENIKIEIPPIILNENNFGRSLDPDELEDLVYLYILDKEKNENLILLPSHCKITEPMYEFYLKDKNNVNEKNITCQVKNVRKVEFSDYLEQKDLFKRIYLFSGINDYGDKREDDKIIKPIPQGKLYECLIEKINYFPFLNNKKYYIIDKKDNNKENSNEEIKIKSEYNDNNWSMHRYNKRLKNKEKRFNVNFFDDDGKILHTASKEYSCDNEIKIAKNRIHSIEFDYNVNGEKGYFYYNNEFKCFIIKNEITKNIIDEAKVIVKEIIGD